MSIPLSPPCVPATFTTPAVFGAEILSINAAPVTNFSASVASALRFTGPSIEVRNATFCNITVTYTHPGQDDSVTVEAWLPMRSPEWNGRLQAVGGGGFAPGRFGLSYGTMMGALGDGYATITTDAGVGTSQEPSKWALLSPGNVNLHKLRNLATVSLNDEAIIGKSLIKSFYGRGPTYSYWNGCSQGGRQGMMLAQRYPKAYDGIAAGAPAIYWPELFASMQWAEVFMNDIRSYPHPCELTAITAAAVKSCDGLDGAVDGVISAPDECLARFDPIQSVGQPLNCTTAGAPKTISKTAAMVANAAWHGPFTRSGKRIWFGLSPGTDLNGQGPYSTGAPSSNASSFLGLATTTCKDGVCTASTFPLSDFWVRYFLAKDPNFKTGAMTRAEYESFAHAARQEYSWIGTDDPDLSEFKAAGGKLMSWHGLDDIVIPPTGTTHYHSAVSALVPNTSSFYRHYEIPGMAHCFGGPAGQPTSFFDQLRAWVENGTAPESSPIDLTVSGQTHHRILCPYPKRARFDKRCGDAALERCWACEK